MNPVEFVAKWSKAELAERAASQEHFLDLCRLLGQPTPAEHDSTGAEYTFEKGVSTADGHGFADAWWRGKFAVEYKKKGKYKTLDAAYGQLLRYREALENPPLLVVTDIARTEIHTNFTGTKKQTHVIELEELTDPAKLDLLRRMFTNPESFRPTVTAAKVTEQVAGNIGDLAQRLRDRGHDPHAAAHFLMKVMFCLFAEDVNLLPKDRLAKVLESAAKAPDKLKPWLDELFAAMATKDSFFWGDPIAWFNGGLFDGTPALELDADEIDLLRLAAAQDWGAVEPAIFGTLFERSLDPSKRAQIGAHYTSRDDIMLVIEPVILRPLRAEWEQVQQKVEEQLERRRKATTPATKRKADEAINGLFQEFLGRIAAVRVLDPACGSGNFLYVAIQQLLALEKEVATFAARPEIGLGLLPNVRPTQLYGIEINPYAAELAQVVIWIGYLQWMRDNGFNVPRDPILSPLTTIERRDAILKWVDESGEAIPVWEEGAKCAGVAGWPEADFVVGNPPFLGHKYFRESGLSDQYVEAMLDAYDIPDSSDLVAYWFEKGREIVRGDGAKRVGLLGTQALRGSARTNVLGAIHETARVFDAWADRNWILEGAAVHVCIVCFSGAADEAIWLNGRRVESLNPDLSAGVDVRGAGRLRENGGIALRGFEKGGAFDLEHEQARVLLSHPNVNGRSSLDVLRLIRNGRDLNGRASCRWVIDFAGLSLESSAGYDGAFDVVVKNVKPVREKNRRADLREQWWLPRSPSEALRSFARRASCYFACCNTFKHWIVRPVVWPELVDSSTTGFASDSLCLFGVLMSSPHELWLRAAGAQLREAESGSRYIPSRCFETFPLPWAPGAEPAGERDAGHEHWAAISAAARELDEARERWLNPPEWIDEIARKVDAAEDFADVAQVSGAEAQRLIRQSAIDAAAAHDARLKKRTLTNLYNARPMWLRLAHRKLDEAVLGAYAAVDGAGGWDVSWAEVFEETGAGRGLPAGHALEGRRGEVEELVLGGLLRLNGERG